LVVGVGLCLCFLFGWFGGGWAVGVGGALSNVQHTCRVIHACCYLLCVIYIKKVYCESLV